MKEQAIKEYKVLPENTLVINNFLNKELIDKRKTEFLPFFDNSCINISSFGRVYNIKGFEYAINAIEQIVAKGYKIKYNIYGRYNTDDSYYSHIRELISNLKLEEVVTLHGEVENPYPYMKISALVLLTSISEGFPNVIIESLYLGTPVVVTNCSDFRGVVEEGKNGFIVEKKNIEEIAKGIEKAIKMRQTFEFDYNNFDYNNFFIKLN